MRLQRGGLISWTLVGAASVDRNSKRRTTLIGPQCHVTVWLFRRWHEPRQKFTVGSPVPASVPAPLGNPISFQVDGLSVPAPAPSSVPASISFLFSFQELEVISISSSFKTKSWDVPVQAGIWIWIWGWNWNRDRTFQGHRHVMRFPTRCFAKNNYKNGSFYGTVQRNEFQH